MGSFEGKCLPCQVRAKSTIFILKSVCRHWWALKRQEVQSIREGYACALLENTLYTYPDMSIVCGKQEYLDKEVDTLLNPKVIVEILSASSRDYDKGGKFTLYRGIPSLEEYILIDSEKVFVERFCKNEQGQWTLSEYKTLNDQLTISNIKFTVGLTEVYGNVFEN